MTTTTLIGALLVTCGVVYMAIAAIFRGRMTDPHSSPGNRGAPTLEPRRAGLGFLGAKANWPGVLIATIGLVLLLIPAM
ncbi:hypothetical protein [Devosia sp.]|uniref:hypothetical protein n=1 Tax=Devosia sp. TaxID=1871048 RepID=UPI002FC78496